MAGCVVSRRRLRVVVFQAWRKARRLMRGGTSSSPDMHLTATWDTLVVAAPFFAA